MEEVAQQKLDYIQDMEAFAAGRGPFAIPERGGSPRSTVQGDSSRSTDMHTQSPGQTAAEDSLHNPLPL